MCQRRSRCLVESTLTVTVTVTVAIRLGVCFSIYRVKPHAWDTRSGLVGYHVPRPMYRFCLVSGVAKCTEADLIFEELESSVKDAGFSFSVCTHRCIWCCVATHHMHRLGRNAMLPSFTMLFVKKHTISIRRNLRISERSKKAPTSAYIICNLFDYQHLTS